MTDPDNGARADLLLDRTSLPLAVLGFNGGLNTSRDQTDLLPVSTDVTKVHFLVPGAGTPNPTS